MDISKQDAIRAINAFCKIINFEQQLVIEAYENEEERIRSVADATKTLLLQPFRVQQRSSTLLVKKQQHHYWLFPRRQMILLWRQSKD